MRLEKSVARGDPPEGEAVRRPCGPEEDGVVRASRWRGHLEEAIEEEMRESGMSARQDVGRLGSLKQKVK